MRFRRAMLWVAWALMPAALTWAQTSQSLHLSDSIAAGARLVGIRDDGWDFRLDKNQSVQTATLVRWGSWPGIVGRQAVWLEDGSWLAGEVEFRDSEMLRLQSRYLKVPDLSLRHVRAVVFTPPASFSEWLRYQSLFDSLSGDQDLLLLRDGRRISGVMEWSSLSSADGRVRLKVSGAEVVVEQSDIAALAASPQLLDPLPNQLGMQIGLSDGTLLCSAAIRLNRANVSLSTATLPGITSFDAPDILAAGVLYLANDAPRNVTWVDQLSPASYKQLSETELQFELGKGRNVYGEPLLLQDGFRAGQLSHGIAMHSSSQAAYRWDRQPGKLLAEVRLAQPTAPIGNVQCKLLLAKSGKLETAEQFDLAVGGSDDLVKWIDVDLTDAQLVVFVVEKGQFGQYGDHVLWLDARLVHP